MAKNKAPSKNFVKDFLEVYQLIVHAKNETWRQINTNLIQLYWNIGKHVSLKVKKEAWGKGIVEELSQFILQKDPIIKGFSARNIWRMKQFFETYQKSESLAPTLTELSWTNHLHILSKTKTQAEREFYLHLAVQHSYSERDFARLIDSSTYERTLLADKKLSAVLTEFPNNAKGFFKDSYIFEFLGISEVHKEVDLRRALLKNLRQFLLELGPDFSMVGEEYLVQIGVKDFRIDLLMHHRELNCLVAIELKVTEFQPEYLGKLQFYLEALDRDIKKPHENPSIGILICKTKDDEVVKYAMSRHISPTMIAEYETKLINKKLLQKKLHELTNSIKTNNQTESYSKPQKEKQ